MTLSPRRIRNDCSHRTRPSHIMVSSCLPGRKSQTMGSNGRSENSLSIPADLNRDFGFRHMHDRARWVVWHARRSSPA